MATNWLDKINQAEKKLGPWRENARKIFDIYRGRNMEWGCTDVAFNLHWSNVELLVGTTYQGTPDPEVERRFKDNGDPVALNLANLIQQALKFSVEAYDFDELMRSSLVDFANCGLGQIRVRYKPYIEQVKGPDGPLRERVPLAITDSYTPNGQIRQVVVDPATNKTTDDYEIDEAGAFRWGEPVEELKYEEVVCEFVPWDCFGWDTDARVWNATKFAYIKHEFGRDDVVKEFGEKVAKDMGYNAQDANKQAFINKKATIYEVFDKVRRRVIVLSEDYQGGEKDDPNVIEDRPDTMKLSGFYPFPKPMLATTTSDRLIPVPYYQIVQDLFEELNRVQRRIFHLVDMLRVRGILNSQHRETLANIFQAPDGHLEPVDGYADLMREGGIANVIATLPFNDISTALQNLMQHREAVKAQIYEVTGFSDLMRGQSKASETLGAQQLKVQFANVRMNKYVRTVDSFVRDLYRLKAELIAEHFQPETLMEITGQQVTDEDMAALRSDIRRAYKIDIQTEVTLAADDEKEQAQRNAFIANAGGLIGQLAPLAQSGMIDPELAKSLLMFGARGFRQGRLLEKELLRVNFAPPPPPAPDGMAGEQGGAPPPG